MKDKRFTVVIPVAVIVLFAAGNLYRLRAENQDRPKRPLASQEKVEKGIKGDVVDLLQKLETQGKSKRLDLHYKINLRVTGRHGRIIQERFNQVTFKGLNFQGQKVTALVIGIDIRDGQQFDLTFSSENIQKHDDALCWKGDIHPALTIAVFADSDQFRYEEIGLIELVQEMAKKGIVYYSILDKVVEPRLIPEPKADKQMPQPKPITSA